MTTRRSPIPSSRASAKQPTQATQQKKTPAELVTYRLDGDMVYVEPAQNFQEALDYAQSVFPQLADIPRSRIAFSVNVRVSGALRTVRIAPMAWPRVLRSLATYEIIDLSILPLAMCYSRGAKSESELATSSQTDLATSDDAPPKYGSGNMLGGDLFRDSEKSPNFLLQVPEPECQAFPPSPAMKRCSSALGWFSRRF